MFIYILLYCVYCYGFIDIEICKKRSNECIGSMKLKDPAINQKEEANRLLYQLAMHRKLAEMLLVEFGNKEKILEYRQELVHSGYECYTTNTNQISTK